MNETQAPTVDGANYGSRPIKRVRRSKSAMGDVRDAIYEVLSEENPMTVRQVFYQLVSLGAVDKTEAEYKQTVVRLLTEMRRDREIPFEWIADNTRWMRKPRTHDSLRSMLDFTKDTYRRALWNDQAEYVEVWLEKDALAGVLYQETQTWDVPLMVTRGYPSLSICMSRADHRGKGKPSTSTISVTMIRAATNKGLPRPDWGVCTRRRNCF